MDVRIAHYFQINRDIVVNAGVSKKSALPVQCQNRFQNRDFLDKTQYERVRQILDLCILLGFYRVKMCFLKSQIDHFRHGRLGRSEVHFTW